MIETQVFEVLTRIANALEEANKINTNQLKYAIDRDRVTFDYMERKDEREKSQHIKSIITPGG